MNAESQAPPQSHLLTALEDSHSHCIGEAPVYR